MKPSLISPQKKHTLEMRSRTIAALRDFFHARGYMEVETPLAVALPGQEPYLHPVPLTLTDDRGVAQPYFLHTSPEYAMKKLLGGGFERIFQITKCFRDREAFGGHHQPEFTMLEWYCTGMDYFGLMREVEDLLTAAGAVWGKTFALPAQRLRVADLMREHAGIDLVDWQHLEGDAYEQRFFDLFLNKVEPALPKTPVFVYDYPAALGALARRKKENPAFVERFELFIDGKEIANAFGELLDAQEQRHRFEYEQSVRLKRGEQPIPIDEELLAALPHILEPTSGIALGIDRLIMACAGSDRIEDVVAFPFQAKE